MRLVLDTNVLVSGIFWGGVPKRIVGAWLDHDHVLLVTQEIFEEYIRVIGDLAGSHDNEAQARWVRHLALGSEAVSPHKVGIRCRDASDQKFLECAVGGGADCVVSGDEDLLVLKEVDGIPIYSPRMAIPFFD